MSQAVARYVAKKFLKENANNNFGREDPYFETVPATRLDGRPSNKTKKIKKRLPPGMPHDSKDAQVLNKVKRRAYRLDLGLFGCCGIRFGWSSVVGIVPVIGDFLDLFMALMVVRTCQQVEGGLPKGIQAKMMLNVMFDAGMELVPFLGDFAALLFKANTRNAIILEKYLRQKYSQEAKRQSIGGIVHDPSDPNVFDQEESNPPPRYTAASSHNNEAPVGKKTGWFGFGRSKQPDVEQGRQEAETHSNGPVSKVPEAAYGGERSETQIGRHR